MKSRNITFQEIFSILKWGENSESFEFLLEIRSKDNGFFIKELPYDKDFHKRL